MATVKYERTIAAMLDHESSNWVIARAMVDEIQPADGKTNLEASDYDGLFQAQRDAGMEEWSYSRATQYRHTAEIFGASDVVDGLSWSAHFVAGQAGNLNAAQAAIKAVANGVGGDMTKVKVANVTAHVRELNAGNGAKNAKKSRSGTVKGLSIARVAMLAADVRDKANFVTPLVKDGRIAELKASLAIVSSWCDWLREAIEVAEKVTPTTITAPKPAKKTAKKAGSQPAQSRGN